MPRGKSRKASTVEVLPSEESSQPMREVKHTAQWVEVRPAEEPITDDSDEEAFELVEEEKAKRRRKTAKDERDDFRRELDKLGVASVSRLKLSIDKYRHSDSDDSGTLAEKDYCLKYPVTKEHILNDDFMDVARKYGPGRYWFTLRMDNKIVRQWERQVNQAVTTTPVIQHVNPVDPTSPQVIIQSDGQQAVMPTIKDIMKGQKEALREHLEMTKLMREAYGFAPEQSQQPKSEEEVLTSAILKQPEVIENVVGSVLKRFGGKGSDDGDPWANVAMEVVKSGQAPQIVRELINGLFNGFGSFFPGRQDNGQSSPTQTQTPDATTTPAIAPTQNHALSDASVNERVSDVRPERTSGTGDGASAPSPAEQALAVVIYNCAHKIPPKITADQILKYADALNDQAPIYSIDGYLDLFAKMTAEQAIEFVKSQPNGEEVAKLDHALAWTTELQKIIREANQEGEE